MKLLLVAATPFEISPLMRSMKQSGQGDDHLFHFAFRKMDVDVLIPGIGMMITAYHMGRQLTRESYTLALNAGIAGTFREDIAMGEVVEVFEEEVTELGAEEGDKILSVFDLKLMEPNTYPFKKGRLVSDRLILIPSIKGLPKVKGSSVNMIHGSKEGISRIKARTTADIESMEGAAFLYASMAAGIPSAQIRAVSNRVEERDKSRWDVPGAVKNLNMVLKNILKELSA